VSAGLAAVTGKAAATRVLAAAGRTAASPDTRGRGQHVAAGSPHGASQAQPAFGPSLAAVGGM